ncbi:MAG TPA: hypothetical protein VG248_15550 [Caulobacteraceae bacterium]|jgi:hypothetical protein|nr:hypothetical protein [Caulobacteraceae bacterium]
MTQKPYECPTELLIQRAGYVCRIGDIIGKPAITLEQDLGYAPGSLADGYAVYLLQEILSTKDFFWAATTHNSDGWTFDLDCGEYIKKSDWLRDRMGRAHGNREAEVDMKLSLFQLGELAKMRQAAAIAKVFPQTQPKAYPDSREGVPQWQLRLPKWFRRVSFVGPGGIFKG